MRRINAGFGVCLGLIALLALALAGCSRSSATAAAAARPARATYTLMQMNLCLSGIAGCYGKVEYPAGVREAVVRIREAHPDAVTINESCRHDVALIARRAGYHLRFSRVIYQGKSLPCVKPGGRGLFGDAVLTKAAIENTDSQPFAAQAGPERREWLCVGTRVGVDVCTAHLASPEIEEVAANEPQCGELRVVLAHPCDGPRRNLRGRPQPSLVVCSQRFLDPYRRVRSPGSREPAGLWNGRARLALGAGGAGHPHRSRLPAGPGLSGPAAMIARR